MSALLLQRRTRSATNIMTTPWPSNDAHRCVIGDGGRRGSRDAPPISRSFARDQLCLPPARHPPSARPLAAAAAAAAATAAAAAAAAATAAAAAATAAAAAAAAARAIGPARELTMLMHAAAALANGYDS